MASPTDLARLIAVARGERPADLLLRNARIINVFSGEIEAGDVAICDGRIAGIGAGYRGVTEVDLAGAYLAPGLIDAHVHIESSLCIPAQFAAAVLPHGVTCAIADPHEIANVGGLPGIRYMFESARGLPLTVRFMAPSCVPATHLEQSGASLDATALTTLLDDPALLGLAEMMNFPGAINGDPGVLAKITAFHGRPIDGHAPLVRGAALNAYVAAGIGSDHECTTVEEAQEKLARGLYILIREATNARNLHALLPLVTSATSRRLCFCTDDRIPADLLDGGSIDMMVREAVNAGVPLVTAIQMATLNTAEWFGLHERGAIAPGRLADLIVFDDPANLQVRQVYAAGRLVAQDGALAADVALPTTPLPRELAASVHIDPGAITLDTLRVPAQSSTLRVIGAIEGQLYTHDLRLAPTVRDGWVDADPARDLLKMAVFERHIGRGGRALGFVQGMGLLRGALAGSVAHDHHNLVCIGADDHSMRTALRAVAAMQGGLVVAEGDSVLAALPLPVAGLMSDRPVAAVRVAYDEIVAAAHALGAGHHDPFMGMSFLALEVIPQLKLTDMGLVDVAQFAFVSLFAAE
ncbi:MAG: adenine deaminase [Caldilineaceae bacterium]